MIKYLCSDSDNGAGNMMLGDTPQEAFEEYKAYYDSEANVEDMYIYHINCQLQGKTQYTFEPVVGT